MDDDLLDFMNDGDSDTEESPKTVDEEIFSELGQPEVPEPIVIKSEDENYEYEKIEVEGQSPLVVKFKKVAKPTEEHALEMWDVIDEFEKKAASPKTQGLTTGWKGIDKAFDGGIKSGFIIVGGDSNLGKSGFISQMAGQIATLNTNAYVMDFSLDDPMQDKIPRVVGSMHKVLLNAVKNPTGYKHLPAMLARRKQGLLGLRQMCDRYLAYDANFSTFIEDIEDEIKRKLIQLQALGLDKQVVVMIDNMHDLNIKNMPGLTDKQKFDYIAQWCADVAIKYDIVLVASAELKKLNGSRRPGLDDIREAVKIKYEAKAIMLVYNEVHYKGEGANVYFTRTSQPTKQPVFEVHFAKNKFGTYKGRQFFEFYPEMARFEEADDQSAKHYASLVFSS